MDLSIPFSALLHPARFSFLEGFPPFLCLLPPLPFQKRKTKATFAASVVAFLVVAFFAVVVAVASVVAFPFAEFVVVAAVFVIVAVFVLGVDVGHPAGEEELPSSVSSSPPPSKAVGGLAELFHLFCCYCCWSKLRGCVVTGPRFRNVPQSTKRPAVGSKTFYN